MSTDFHFPDLEQQFERIELDVIKANEWRAMQKQADEGDRISLKSSGSSSSEVCTDTFQIIGTFINPFPATIPIDICVLSASLDLKTGGGGGPPYLKQGGHSIICHPPPT